eukprot:gene3073-5243_t
MVKKEVYPGNKIYEIKEGEESTDFKVECGKGCYRRNQKIYSSLVGKAHIELTENEKIIHVLPKNEEITVPSIGSIVTCKVIKITKWYAKVNILCVDGKVLKSENIEGMIRTQDIRLSEIDKIKIDECFKPGDILKAIVISLGDSRNYYLSTASNEFGVIYATSILGESPMIPVSWKEMES